jgi:hypothetical protein
MAGISRAVRLDWLHVSTDIVALLEMVLAKQVMWSGEKGPFSHVA